MEQPWRRRRRCSMGQGRRRDASDDNGCRHGHLQLLPHHQLKYLPHKTGDHWRHSVGPAWHGRVHDRPHKPRGNGRAGRFAKPGGQCRREGRAAASQPAPEPEPASGQPALDGCQRPVKLTGCLFVSHALEIAQIDRAPVLERQAVDFITDDLADFTLFQIAVRIIGGYRRNFTPKRSSPTCAEAGPNRDAMCHTVEPTTEGIIDVQ